MHFYKECWYKVSFLNAFDLSDRIDSIWLKQYHNCSNNKVYKLTKLSLARNFLCALMWNTQKIYFRWNLFATDDAYGFLFLRS